MSKQTTREKLDNQLDKKLLDIIKGGVILTHPKTGEVIVGKDNKPVKVPPPHQILEIARKRLSDLGLTKEVADNSTVAELTVELERNPERLEAHGIPEFIPAVSEEPDVAVG